MRKAEGAPSTDILTENCQQQDIMLRERQYRLACEDNLSFIERLPGGYFKLIVTSPPYNIGKPYEGQLSMQEYIEQQRQVITECVRLLAEDGSICW